MCFCFSWLGFSEKPVNWFRLSVQVQATAGLGSENYPDEIPCQHCHGTHAESEIVTCDHCDGGFHVFCVSPELTEFPTGDWACPVCLSAEDDPLIVPKRGRSTHQRYQADALRFHRAFTGAPATANKVQH